MTLLAPPRRDAERPRSARDRRAPWILLVLLVALAITVVGIFPFRQIIAQHRQVDMTQAKLDALVGENARLEGEIELLQTPTEMERIAREEFGVVRRGETAYMATAPDEDPVPSAPQSELVGDDMASEGSFFRRVWDFLTGRDLVPDG